MSHPVIFRRAARMEFDAAGGWYERQRKGLGIEFTAAVQETLDRILLHPQVYRQVYRDIRRAIVPGFPYAVYFRERQSGIIVVAVFNSSRDPSIWMSRR